MANRYANKRLRAACRERMAATGETYQQARQGLLEKSLTKESLLTNEPLTSSLLTSDVLAKRQRRSEIQTDLQSVRYHGFPATLVTIEQHGAVITLLMPALAVWPQGYPARWPASLLRSWMKPRGGLQ